ncbi:hypothetical protein EYV94_20070 [Puteibacter caeruleilacunae]|nr:hypothetical protein EYV94_20070 [Puteibacter caeruleilacunae]
MGIGYTVDTPLKVAQYGISSVVSLVDDILVEKMREFYSQKFDLPFQGISNKIEDFRAKRITAYLDLMDKLVKENLEEVKHSIHEKSSELDKYMEMLPDVSSVKAKFKELTNGNKLKELQQWVQQNLTAGSIDVNIMTKLDRENYSNGEQLPSEYNDAHAALRGFANSTLNSSVVLSAGMNPRLYSYCESFEQFYPDANGNFNKKIILKVSDYRSALIQGKIFAKKGLWISEYRIESGLNCGGHAFATDGHLLGPILEDFKKNREALRNDVYELYANALKAKERYCPEEAPEMLITAQGGVGTSEEHEFLMDYYNLDSIGWGTPFMLAQDVITIDDDTLQQLVDAKEDDLYLSEISPLGVMFNNLRGNSKDIQKENWVKAGTPGSPCTKKYASINREFTEHSICTASRQYQKLKLEELKNKNLPEAEYKRQFDKIVEKACICVGLGTSALMKYNLDTKLEGPGVSICPGPNLAYYSKKTNLKEMVDHIYGRVNLMTRPDRPNLFVKELGIYVNYMKDKVEELRLAGDEKGLAGFKRFQRNMDKGIAYYKELFTEVKAKIDGMKENAMEQIEALENELKSIELKI